MVVIIPSTIAVLISFVQHPSSTALFLVIIAVIVIKIMHSKAQMIKEKEIENYRECVDRHSMGCRKCGSLVMPNYIGLGTGHHQDDELWKYMCSNCGRSWKEYWPMGS